jgi:hypothetical protein
MSMARKKPLLHAVASVPESRACPPPAPGLFPESWGGHQHATRVALAMIYEHATRGNGALSANERILTRVCELRCALASGEWLGRLRANCPNELAAARFILNEIGAMKVAACISATVTALRRAHLVQQREALLAKLERDLHAAGPALDTLIARFAQTLLDAGGGYPEEVWKNSPPDRGDGVARGSRTTSAGRKIGG